MAYSSLYLYRRKHMGDPAQLQSMDVMVQFGEDVNKPWASPADGPVPEGIYVYDTVTKLLKRGDGNTELENLPVHLDFSAPAKVAELQDKFPSDLTNHDGEFLEVRPGGGGYVLSGVSIKDLVTKAEFEAEYIKYSKQEHHHNDRYYTKNEINQLIGQSGGDVVTGFSSKESKLISFLLMNKQEAKDISGMTFRDGASWEFEEGVGIANKYLAPNTAGNNATLIEHPSSLGYSVLNRNVSGIRTTTEGMETWVSTSVKYEQDVVFITMNIRIALMYRQYQSDGVYKTMDLSTVLKEGNSLSNYMRTEVSRDGGRNWAACEMKMTPIKVPNYYKTAEGNGVNVYFISGGSDFSKEVIPGSINVKSKTFPHGDEFKIRMTNLGKEALNKLDIPANDDIGFPGYKNGDYIEGIIHGVKFNIY